MVIHELNDPGNAHAALDEENGGSMLIGNIAKLTGIPQRQAYDRNVARHAASERRR